MFLGIIFIVVSAIIVVHLFVFLLLEIDGKPVHPFLNKMFEDIENSNASFFAVVIFALIGYYLLFSALKGNMKVGMRFFFFSFYPMR